MNLLEIFEENQKRIEEENQQDNERAFNKEIREIKSEIILGEKEHYSNNKELLEKLEIKFKIKKIYSFMESYQYCFDYNKTNIKKIQKYLDKQLEQN